MSGQGGESEETLVSAGDMNNTLGGVTTVTIEANIPVGEEIYDISVQSLSPTAAATLMLRARRKLLAGLKKEEEDESNHK